MIEAADLAAKTFESHLKNNSYPGRGLVVGRSTVDDAWALIYWIMGRSDNSRNRRFVVEGTTLKTEPVDLAKVADPSLIIYEAMLELPGVYIVSNGDQTRTLHDTLAGGGTFDEALSTREREPDAPNYTPRISAMLDMRSGAGEVTLSYLKANPIDVQLTDRYTVRPAAPAAGFGAGLTTYMGDGDPLPAFTGDPLLLPCVGDAETIADTYWDALDVDNRISLAVNWITPDGTSRLVVRNRCEL